MYPIVLLIAIGILRRDEGLPYSVLPLASVGWVISLYHNLLYYQILPHSAAPCQAGISCTAKYIEWFGFITIPFLSLIAFTVIIACMAALLRFYKRNPSL